VVVAVRDEGLPLFDWPGRRPARARTSDPAVSHAAADRAERDGTIRGHAARIIRALVEGGPGTASEVGARCGLTNVQVDRRAKELVLGCWITRRESSRCELVLVATRKAEEWAR
jgi:hypothetical protein